MPGMSPRSHRPLLARGYAGNCPQTTDSRRNLPKAAASCPPAVDIFECVFDSVGAMGAGSVMPLLPRRHDQDALPGSGRLPVLPALRELLPGGLQRGTVVAVGSWGLLCLAVAAGASAAGACCAAVGLPQLAVPLASAAGLHLERL